VFGMRNAVEGVMCAGFAENKGMQQENVSIKKRQKGRRLKGGGKGDTEFSRIAFCTRG